MCVQNDGATVAVAAVAAAAANILALFFLQANKVREGRNSAWRRPKTSSSYCHQCKHKTVMEVCAAGGNELLKPSSESEEQGKSFGGGGGKDILDGGHRPPPLFSAKEHQHT